MSSRNLPQISVVIPCYNHGKYIEEAIHSILQQTFRNYEIIVVNDGSNDDSTILTLEYLHKKYPEITFINQVNKGLANARNTGIKKSKAKYILPLDADDKIHPEMLKECYETLEKHPDNGFVYTQTRLFGKDDAFWSSKEYDFDELLKGNYIVATSLIRKKAWEDIGGYDESMLNGYEDWEFYIHLGIHGWTGKLIPKELFYYRKHGYSLISKTYKHGEEIVRYISQKHSKTFVSLYINETQMLTQTLNHMSQSIASLTESLAEKNAQITHMQSSKFWKLRNIWHKAKWGVKNPIKFYKTYSGRIVKKVFKVITAPFNKTKS